MEKQSKTFRIFRFHNDKLTDEVTQSHADISDLVTYWEEWDKKQFKIKHAIPSDLIELGVSSRMESGNAISFQNFVSGYDFDNRIGGQETFNYTIVRIK